MEVGISGQFVVGGTLSAAVNGGTPPYTGRWEVRLANGQWTQLAGSTPEIVVPAWAEGLSIRLVVDDGPGVVYGEPTPAIGVETRHENAPEFSGWDTGIILIGNGEGPLMMGGLFSRATFADPDRSSYRDGTLRVESSTSLSHGGDGLDDILLGPAVVPGGQIAYDAATRELSFRSYQDGSVRVIGLVDEALDGDGDDLLVHFNKYATHDAINAVIDAVSFYDEDGSTMGQALLTLRVTDGSGLSAQIVQPVPVVTQPEEPPPSVDGGMAEPQDPVIVVVGSVVIEPA